MYISNCGYANDRRAQQPSAVIEATVKEFEKAKHMQDIWVMKVANLWSGSSIPDYKDHIRVGHYVQIVRPQIDPLGQKEQLLLLPGPVEMVRMVVIGA